MSASPAHNQRCRTWNPALAIILVACLLPACGWTEHKYLEYIGGAGDFIEGTQQDPVVVDGFDSSRNEIDLRQLKVVQLGLSPAGSRPAFDSLSLTLTLARPLGGVGEPPISAVQAVLHQGTEWVELSAPAWTVSARLVVDRLEDLAREDPASWGDRVMTQQASGRFAAVLTSSSGQQLKVQSCSITMEVYQEKAGLLE